MLSHSRIGQAPVFYEHKPDANEPVISGASPQAQDFALPEDIQNFIGEAFAVFHCGFRPHCRFIRRSEMLRRYPSKSSCAGKCSRGLCRCRGLFASQGDKDARSRKEQYTIYVRSYESSTNYQSEPATFIGEAVDALIAAKEKAQVVRWIEFPAAVLLLLLVPGDSQSGAFYVIERGTNTWLWLDFEDGQYGGYSISDFDLLVNEYDFLSLVERPALLRADSGWLLEPGKPAEMAAPCK